MIMIGLSAQCREHVGTCWHVDKCEIGVFFVAFHGWIFMLEFHTTWHMDDEYLYFGVAK